MPPPTPGRTPGKGKRERPYVLFNDNPRERGTHSGRPMPTNVPLNEDGVEDPEEFFRSSPSISMSASTSRRTTLGGVSVAPSSVGQSRRLTKGRMSQLDGSDDDEMDLGYDAVDDEDEIGDSNYFGPSNPTTVPLPRRSELGPATPGTNVDDLPSPSVSISASRVKSTSKRKSALSRSPNQTISRRSMATTINQSPLGPELDFGDDSMLLQDDTTMSPTSRRQSRRETIATNGEVVSPAATNRQRQSTASKKSHAQAQGDDEEDDEEAEDGRQPEPSYEYDNDPVDGGAGEGVYNEDMSAEEAQADAELEMGRDDNANSENGQIAEDEDTGEETAVERPAEKAKRAKAEKAVKAKVKARPRAQSRQRRDSSDSSDGSPIKRARVSGFPLPGADEDNEYKGDFKCRRSGRSHIAPLKWWIGEHVEYQPGEHLAEVREVVRLHEEARPSFAAKRKAAIGRTRSKSRRSESAIDPDLRDGTGFDAATKQFAVVWDFPTATQDDHRRIAMPYDKLAPTPVTNGAFEYQKVFGEEAFAAAGVIRIPPGSSKPGKSSKDNAFFFFVFKGGLNVNVHRTSFNMGPGAMFMIPRGNKYSIENISDVDAELFFAQSRKAVMTEQEERLLAELNDSITTNAQTAGAGGSGKKRKSAEPEPSLRKKAIAGSKKR